MTDHPETPKKRRKEADLQLLYRVADTDPQEAERQVDQAFDVLFDFVLQSEFEKRAI